MIANQDFHAAFSISKGSSLIKLVTFAVIWGKETVCIPPVQRKYE